MDVTPQVLHDWLLENKPSDASHDPVSCAICIEKASNQEENVAADPIFTEEQHQELLRSAVEKATTEVRTEVDAEILSLNEQLEEAKTALAEKDEDIASLKASIEERDEAERLAALATERVEQVSEIASFSDEQISARRDAWAKMSEEDWDSYLEDIKAVAAAKPTSEDPPPSNFDGTRETAGEEGTESFVISSFFKSDLDAAAQL